jgi:hypothetical protein
MPIAVRSVGSATWAADVAEVLKQDGCVVIADLAPAANGGGKEADGYVPPAESLDGDIRQKLFHPNGLFGGATAEM